jgi:hypothetical protein
VLDPFSRVDVARFQSIFGMIMTVLIALEFNHAITRNNKHPTP